MEFYGFPSKDGKFASDIPLSMQNHFIISDEKRIKQVVMNLQSNALKFTRDGGQIRMLCEYIRSSNKKVKIPAYFDDYSEASDDSEAQDGNNINLSHKIENVFTADPQYDKIVISVIDTGIGIKPEDRRRLFKLFGTVSSTRQMNTNGIGLGLVISENIVNSFGGSIGLRTKYGKGSKFAFSILLTDAET